MRILITGGPTREYLDDVRCLTNPSSGLMGLELALASARRGHETILVTGPAAFPDPFGVTVIRVESALEMAAAVARHYKKCDALIASAAVSDYRPARRARGKIKKGPARMTLRLVRNPDILATCGRSKGKRRLVGFALEAGLALDNAREKLLKKNLDLVVLNGPGSFGSEKIEAVLLAADCSVQVLAPMSKTRLAERIVKFLEEPLPAACDCHG